LLRFVHLVDVSRDSSEHPSMNPAAAGDGMSVVRSILLAASQNAWLREHASHYRFVRRSVARFMR